MSAEALLREMYAVGVQMWSAIAVPWEDYRRHCERICGELPPSEELVRYAADIYLCCACAHQNPQALSVFQREAEPVVRAAIARVHYDTEFVSETQQEFWKKLLAGPDAKVSEYRGRGPLQAWLRVAATRLALDRQRAQCLVVGRETHLGDYLVAQAFGPESTLTRERFHEPFREALRSALLGLTSKDRNLLRMHVVGRCSIDQIGRAYGVHRATAARWLEQAKQHILEAVRGELRVAVPQLTDSEFLSVARAVGGELELDTSLLRTEVSEGGAPSEG